MNKEDYIQEGLNNYQAIISMKNWKKIQHKTITTKYIKYFIKHQI